MVFGSCTENKVLLKTPFNSLCLKINKYIAENMVPGARTWVVFVLQLTNRSAPEPLGLLPLGLSARGRSALTATLMSYVEHELNSLS